MNLSKIIAHKFIPVIPLCLALTGCMEEAEPDCQKAEWDMRFFETQFEHTLIPGLTEELKSQVLARPEVSSSVKRVGGRVRLLVNGKPTEPVVYHAATGMQPHHGHYTIFKDAGVKIHTRTMLVGQGVLNTSEGNFWKGEGDFDFSGVEEQLWRVLRADPDANILVHIWLDPYYDWGKENPFDVCLNDKGEKAVGNWHVTGWGGSPSSPKERYLPSVYSAKLRADITDMVTRLVSHIENSPLGKTVVGYSLAGMNDGQWVNWAHWSEHLDDYSPAAKNAFREWIRERYGNDVNALRAAWKNPAISFEDVSIPSPERRKGDGIFLDASFVDVADFNRFYAEVPFQTTVESARIIKKITGGKKIVTTYYASPMNGAPSGTGLGHLLENPWIDMFQCPSDYGVRMVGLSSGSQTIFSSISLHNKIFLHEQDWRSFLVPSEGAERDYSVGRAPDAESHNNMVRRDSGMQIAHGQGTWFFDIGNSHFRDHGIMKGVAEAVCAFQYDLRSNAPLEADVAFFVSERSLDFLTFPMRYNYQWYLLRRHRNNWVESGVPYHLYLQSDLTNPKISDYKVYIFLNPQFLTEDDLAKIEELKKRGKTLVFCHAPGMLVSGDAEKTIQEITGIQVKQLPERVRLAGTFIEGDNPLQKGLKGNFGDALFGGPTGNQEIIAEAFAVEDDAAVPLATFMNSDKVAIAARDFGTWKSVFFAVPRIEPQLLHNIARWASAWTISEPGDAIFANQNFVTIHALRDGRKKLQLKYPSRVTDLISHETFPDKRRTLDFEMKAGETRWFGLAPSK